LRRSLCERQVALHHPDELALLELLLGDDQVATDLEDRLQQLLGGIAHAIAIRFARCVRVKATACCCGFETELAQNARKDFASPATRPFHCRAVTCLTERLLHLEHFRFYAG
jgi:hypothetical protein